MALTRFVPTCLELSWSGTMDNLMVLLGTTLGSLDHFNWRGRRQSCGNFLLA